jgi:hypothetical protein
MLLQITDGTAMNKIMIAATIRHSMQGDLFAEAA